MSAQLLHEKYEDEMAGLLHCYDRIVIGGHLQPLCYAKGMTRYLYEQNIRIFDYARFAEPLRERIRENAARLASENGLKIEFVSHSQERKEARIEAVLQERGDQPGLVHIISAMEQCPSYQPWHDKESHKTYLKPKRGKCLHYYFYFIDAELGLC